MSSNPKASSWKEILQQLERGEIRAAHFNSQTKRWEANSKVKEGILDAFRNSPLATWEQGKGMDKEDLFPQSFDPSRKIRVVPGGTSIRKGAYLAPGVVVMPPAYVNVGAYVDTGSMIDSHALVGSCAQVGKNVHISAGVQIGGVLEPVGATPVVIGDDCFLGAGSVIVEGVQLGEGCIVAPGTILSKGLPIYDLVEQKILTGEKLIPAGAMLVPGGRPISAEKNQWGHDLGLSMKCALIIKYSDSQKVHPDLQLEQALR